MIRLLATAAALIVPLPSGVASFPAEPAHAAPVPAPRAFSLEGVAEQGGILMGEADARTTALSLDGKPVDLAPDGVFLIGFDRDAPASALLIEEGEGWRAEHPIVVAPRAWRIERVDAPYRAGRTDAEFASLRPAEVAQIAAARRIHTDAGGWRQAFRWPATGRQSGWFGSQRVYRGKPGSYHSGADVAVPTGTPIVAPADGVVILAADRPFTLEGNLLMLDHGAGLSSAFLHLSRIDVRPGDRVRAGQPIALSGATGRATGPHLHWGLQWRGAKLDPLLLAGPVPAR
ncbi:MAG: M23 family metallopeptidase [Sphingomonas sp.]|nr:MAG: M23 family metallopeptidase [Sphingomonas sp.]